MNKVIGLFCLLSISAFSIETKRVENLSNINKVFIDGGNLKVKIINSSEEKIELLGDTDRIKDIKIEVVGNKLKIKEKELNNVFFGSSKNQVQINVNIKKLDTVELDGSADVSINDFTGENLQYKLSGSGSGEIINNNYKNYELILGGSGDINLKANAEKIKIDLEGSGKIEGDIKAQYLEALIDGSGDIELKGLSKEFIGTVEGSGSIDAYDLKSLKTKILISGSGDAKVYVTEEFTGTIEGSGDIKYKGNPKSEKINDHGSGTVSKK